MQLNKSPIIGILAFIIVLFVMPLGHTLMILIEKFFGHQYQFLGAFGIGLIGAWLLYIGFNKNNETPSTWYGFFAGVLLWTGWVEFSFVFYAKLLNIQPLMEDGDLITKPEYLIMPSSVGLLLSTLLYFFFNKQTQCRFFTWFHRNLKMNLPENYISNNRNYSTITALETIYITWFFYVLLLITYDKSLIGDRHWFTYFLFAVFLIWSLYLFIRLLKFNKIAPAIRYAIPTVIIFWNCIEILGRWDFFKEIWLHPEEYALELIIMLGSFIIVTLLSIFSPKEKQVD
jgi:hypothetical protein